MVQMAKRVTSRAVHEYSDTPTRWNAFSWLSTRPAVPLPAGV
eukprot:COSAG02_NODE_11823_length_1647_cov_1.877907_2_plen_41_part_01